MSVPRKVHHPKGSVTPQASAAEFDGTVDAASNTQRTTTNNVNPMTSFGIWVAVRVRPFNKRELQDTGSAELASPQPVVEVERDGKTMTLLDPSKGFCERANFSFDYSFSAFRPSIELDGDPKSQQQKVADPVAGAQLHPEASKGDESDSENDDEDEAKAEKAQSEIYDALGKPIVSSAWQGYNGCIFAYGQTSSGKTYTMMGTKRDPGIIPRLCRALFEKIEEELAREGAVMQNATDTGVAPPQNKKMTKCSVSYMEIYNEQVKDLLKSRPKGQKPKFNSRFDSNPVDDEYQNLRVRQHPLHGPFVEGLTKVDVTNWLECVRVIRQGNEVRSSCSTELNDSSSRSHAIFQMVLTQTEALGAKVHGKEVLNHRVSKINLVDLAGSERTSNSHVTGKHMTEANYINQSLSTLRKVIDVLVVKKKPGATIVIPYRESLLTWILSDNFGGNSKTVMVANVSPHHSSFLETESTLRYATLAKGIINRVRVNEDPSAKLIRELQAQLKSLQQEMSHGPQQERVRELEEQMEENKRAMEELLVREEGMRQLIQESRQREEQLRHEKESLEKDQQRWKSEAERLRKEKEELKSQLTKLADGTTTLDSEKKKNFWLTEEEPNGAADAPPADDGSTCPPQPQVLRRKSSARFTPKSAVLPDPKKVKEEPAENGSQKPKETEPPKENDAPREKEGGAPESSQSVAANTSTQPPSEPKPLSPEEVKKSLPPTPEEAWLGNAPSPSTKETQAQPAEKRACTDQLPTCRGQHTAACPLRAKGGN